MFANLPTDEVVRLAYAFAEEASSLRGLHAPEYWSDQILQVWDKATRDFPALSASRCTDDDIVALLRLPAKAIGPALMGERKARSADPDDPDFLPPKSASSPLLAIVNLFRFGERSKAMRLLTSYGLAPEDARTLELLIDLHPKDPTIDGHVDTEKPYFTHTPTTHPSPPTNPIPTETIKSMIRQKCTYTSTALDSFGWATWLFKSVANDDSPRFMDSAAVVVQRLAAASEVSNNLALLLSLGKLIALLKKPNNPPRAADTPGPLLPLPSAEPTPTRKIRPVNIGVTFLKLGCQAILQDPGTKEYLTALEDLQFGGATRGCERVNHFFRLKFLSGCPVFSFDFANAFNSLFRSVMIQTAPPLMHPTMVRYYGCSSLISWQGKRITGHRGAKQGDPMGQAAFHLSVHQIWVKFVELHKNLCGRAITDDWNTSTRRRPATDAEWHKYYEDARQSIATLEKLSAPLGLTLSAPSSSSCYQPAPPSRDPTCSPPNSPSTETA